MIERGASPSAGWQSVEAPPKPQKPKKKRGLGWLVAMQSAACAVLLVAALLLRAAGGDAYVALRDRFCESIARNDLLATIAALWDGDPADMVAPELQAENDHAPSVSGTAGRRPPSGATAVNLLTNHIPHLPMTVGTLTSGYGYRDNPTGQGRQFHPGVDIAAPYGTPIAALFYGTVKTVGEEATLGRYVVLDHGAGVQVMYAHCAEIVASQGAVVRGGETVALVGSTGDSTGNHVHIQVTDDGLIYNPTAIASVTRYV